MGKRIKILDLPSSGFGAALLILSAAFVIGGLAGCIFADWINANSGSAFQDYLNGYFSAIRSGCAEKPEVIYLLWNVVRWPLVVILFCFTPLGLLGIPVLFLIRSFLLSFSITSFYGALGADGLLVSFGVLGIAELIGIPVLFVLGTQSFLSACTVTGRLMGDNKKGRLVNRSTLVCWGICMIALYVCSLIEYYVVPAVMSPLADYLLGI